MTQTTFKQTIGTIHRWIGMSTGLIVCILGITGCIFCFEREIKSLVYSQKLYIEPSNRSPLSLDQLFTRAQNALGPETPINRLEIQRSKNRSIKCIASRYQADAWNYNQQFPYHKTVYIHPFTGQVLAVENTKYEFFTLVLYLHYNLLLGSIGHQIVGWSTILFVIMLISGLILWWPKNQKALRQRLWFIWKDKTSWKRKNYDLHYIPGFYALFFAFCIAISGLYFAFDWFRPLVFWTANGFRIPAKELPVSSDTLVISKTEGLIQRIYDEALQTCTDGQQVLISIPDKKDKATPIRIHVYHNSDNYLRRSSLAFDQKTGNLLKSKPYDHLSGAEKFVSSMYDIHVGRILGIPGMLVAFFSSAVVTLLPITGFLVWWGRKTKKQSQHS